MQVAFKKGKDHVENIFYLQGQEQVHCTGKRNYHTGAGSEMLLPVRTLCCREHISAVPQERPRAGTTGREDARAWCRCNRDEDCSAAGRNIAGQDAGERRVRNAKHNSK